MRLNPLSWGRPLQIVAVLGAALGLYLVLSGIGATAYARHIANKAMRGIASTISDIDATEGKVQGLEHALSEVARQTQELEAKAAQEREARLAEQAENARLRQQAQAAQDLVDRLRKADQERARVTTLEAARDAINRAVESRRQP